MQRGSQEGVGRIHASHDSDRLATRDVPPMLAARLHRFRYQPVLLAACFSLLALSTGPADAQSAFRSGFDHFTTSWPLDGAHQNADCETCHVEGIFKGTPRECAACHNRGGLVKATAPPRNHIRSTAQCQDCHSVATWAARRVDHTQVLGSCRTCHDGNIATGKPPDHPPASNQCELCHSTSTWSFTAFLAPASSEAVQVARSAPPAETRPQSH
jgi:hypothetical protein